MRLVVPLAAIAVITFIPAFAQVSGMDTTRSREDRAAFPDPTLPQANTYIPQVRQKVSTPLSELVEEEDSDTGASPEEVAAFIGIEDPQGNDMGLAVANREDDSLPEAVTDSEMTDVPETAE